MFKQELVEPYITACFAPQMIMPFASTTSGLLVTGSVSGKS